MIYYKEPGGLPRVFSCQTQFEQYLWICNRSAVQVGGSTCLARYRSVDAMPPWVQEAIAVLDIAGINTPVPKVGTRVGIPWQHPAPDIVFYMLYVDKSTGEIITCIS